MSIWDYFDVPESRREIAEGDSLSSPSSTQNKHTNLSFQDSILEFTVNTPANKNYSEDQYRKIINKLISSIPERCPLDSASLTYYLEKCKSKKVHLHGFIRLKKENFYIEGVLQEFVKLLISAVDKRYSVNFWENYYSTLCRYRTPTICVQYTDEAERIAYWGNYITKEI